MKKKKQDRKVIEEEFKEALDVGLSEEDITIIKIIEETPTDDDNLFLDSDNFSSQDLKNKIQNIDDPCYWEKIIRDAGSAYISKAKNITQNH